jgi:hypothetical protein
MKMKNKIRPIVGLLCATIVLFLTSCVDDGFIDHYIFSSGVTNSTLLSPLADSIKFTPILSETFVTISWPVVNGAGGYKVTFEKVDNPTNPVVVGTANQVVDGISVTDSLATNTHYQFVIQTMGNTQYNNKSALTATTVKYSTYAPAYDSIPSGTDLAQYFQLHPVPSSDTTLIYQLVAGGTYTMNGSVATGLTNVTFRGDKVTHPIVTMSATSGEFVSDGAGIILNTIDFDCTNFKGSGLITFNSTLNSKATTCTWGTLVTSLVALQSCKITGLAEPLIYDNAQKYALQTLTINDCIIGTNTTSKNLISDAGGFVKDLTISNSTIYNTQQYATAGYMIQYGNDLDALKITGAGWSTCSITLTNSTFWQMYSEHKIANYSGFALSSSNTLTLKKCIFVDCDNTFSVSSILHDASNTPTRVFGLNTYWATWTNSSSLTTVPSCPPYEIYNSSTYPYADNSGTVIQSDPQLKSPSTGDFTVQGAAQLAAKTGDPRWL